MITSWTNRIDSGILLVFDHVQTATLYIGLNLMIERDFLVLYDLHDTPRDYSRLYVAMKLCGKTKRVQQSAWLIRSLLDEDQVREILRRTMQPGDSLIVLPVQLRDEAGRIHFGVD